MSQNIIVSAQLVKAYQPIRFVRENFGNELGPSDNIIAAEACLQPSAILKTSSLLLNLVLVY